jgi:hypothetical protein
MWLEEITGRFVEGLVPSVTFELIACPRLHSTKSDVKVGERGMGDPIICFPVLSLQRHFANPHFRIRLRFSLQCRDLLSGSYSSTVGQLTVRRRKRLGPDLRRAAIPCEPPKAGRGLHRLPPDIRRDREAGCCDRRTRRAPDSCAGRRLG